jgi:preprotein translocase subunit SecE
MGRLQKKKTPNKSKKKKQSDIIRSGSTVQTATAQNKIISAVSTQKEAVKKTTDLQKRTSVVSKSITDNNFIGKSIQFLREVKVELKKVTWPSKKQTMGSTLVVIILVMIISLFLGLVDVGLSGIIRVVFQ